MNGLVFFIEGILPYIATVVFVGGTALRLWYWLRTPVPLNINLAPAKTTWKAVTGKIAAEVLLFISLLRNDKTLWIAAWVMHVCGLIVIVASHFFGIIDASVDTYTPYTIPFGKTVLYVAALFAFPLIGTLLFLLFKRLLTGDIRRISIPTDYVAIGLLLAHVLGGTYMSFFTEIDMGAVAAWGTGLFTFRPVVVEGSWIFAVHSATCFITLMYFPFSKLFHPLGQITNRWTMTQKEAELIPGGRIIE
jgi:nitrate reductase gamma subunit